jgi:hypothetical protein
MANAGRLTALPQGISRKVTVMNWSCRMGQLRALAAGVMLTTLLVALLPLSAQEQQPAQPAQEQQLLSDIQLQQLVAPIALYPDSLLAQSPDRVDLSARSGDGSALVREKSKTDGNRPAAGGGKPPAGGAGRKRQ